MMIGFARTVSGREKKYNISESSNGRNGDFESLNVGSIPASDTEVKIKMGAEDK